MKRFLKKKECDIKVQLLTRQFKVRNKKEKYLNSDVFISS